MSVTMQMIGVILFWCADQGSYDLVGKMKEMLGNLYNLREDLRE